ncbi:MAG: insulinase family protein, partial [Planctomycetota bacterium]
CYAVGAKYRTLKDFAGISCYAGTTPDKAQETLDVIIEQFNELKNGITEDEMQRVGPFRRDGRRLVCTGTGSFIRGNSR